MNKIDQAKSAFANVIRALGGDRKLDVVYGESHYEISGNQAKMPNIDKPEQTKQLRGLGDRLGIERATHNPILFLRQCPQEDKNCKIFTALEQGRQHILADRQFVGVGKNILEYYANEFKDSSFAMIPPEKFASPPPEIIRAMFYEINTDNELPKIFANHSAKWQATFGAMLQAYFSATDLNNQEEFGKQISQFLNILGDAQSQYPQDNQEEIPPEQNQQDSGGESDDDNEEKDPENDTQTDQNSDLFRRISQSSDDLDNIQTINPHDLLDQQKREELASMLSGYRVFTNEFDIIQTAREIVDSAEEMKNLREVLDQSLSAFRDLSPKLTHRLERKLRAQQNRHWNFNLEEGLLDTSRLTRIITNPKTSLSYKQESEIDFRDTMITLLIDNSGSMRGRPINIAAMSADILARVMDRCGVKTEICGFTTVSWKGGKSREQWQAQGRIKNPGRLNDILYIIYKHADQSYHTARSGLGVMLKNGLLKENIDGEALEWATQRLLKRPEQRKILMVISDGAPVDDATLSANKNYYLEQHLRDIIAWVEKHTQIELTAIGIGHDVTRYYKRAVTLSNAEALATTMLNELTELFDKEFQKKKSKKNR